MPTKKLQMLGYKIVPPEHIGKSAYEIAVDKGFEGTETEWLEYLATLKVNTVSDLNKATSPGFYKVGSSTSNMPTEYIYFRGGTATLIVEVDDRGDVYQTIRALNVSAKRYYNKNTSFWTPWVYINPPFNTDIEYLTDGLGGGTVLKKITNDGVLKWKSNEQDEWQTYAHTMGAAPDGFGLGDSGKIVKDIDEATKSGFYALAGDACTNFPEEHEDFRYGTLLVENSYDAFIKQTFFHNGVSAVRYATWVEPEFPDEPPDDYVHPDPYIEWSELEFINPPFEQDTIYRTIDRVNEKVVYKKMTSKGVMHHLEGDDDEGNPVWKYPYAPDGYGLGQQMVDPDVDILDDANNATKCGWYRMHPAITQHSPGFVGLLRVDAYSDKNIVQTAHQFHRERGDYVTTLRRIRANDGDWSEWAYENPPRYAGVEYRTTEMYFGKPVYFKNITINLATEGTIGSETSDSIKQFKHGIDNLFRCVRCEAYFTAGFSQNGNGINQPIPQFGLDNGALKCTYISQIDDTHIALRLIHQSWGQRHVVFNIYYIKEDPNDTPSDDPASLSDPIQ